jgi:hypothetical protein
MKRNELITKILYFIVVVLLLILVFTGAWKAKAAEKKDIELLSNYVINESEHIGKGFSKFGVTRFDELVDFWFEQYNAETVK